jgi:two-component system nitrate/nitrite response regulator NarL
MVKILIIDDHPLVTDGIRTMLNDVNYVRISGAVKTGAEAVAFLQENPETDLILLDINLPDTDGLKLCELIRQKNKSIRIIGLTYVNEAGIISQMIKNGANGYMLKSMEREELIGAINAVMDGRIYLSPDANEKIIQQLRNYQISGDAAPLLTRREKEILELLSEGLTSNQIAEKLYLSTYTVDTHRKNMLQKFNVHNTQSLIRAAKDFMLL